MTDMQAVFFMLKIILVGMIGAFGFMYLRPFAARSSLAPILLLQPFRRSQTDVFTLLLIVAAALLVGALFGWP